ncbi:MAG: IS1595 family transposase [Bryobacteraceae bacterium]|jgi:transposase-like protein
MREELQHLSKSAVIEAIPLACSDELCAVEFFEALRWGGVPSCAHCNSTMVYKMTGAATGNRNRRFLWRCRECKKQYTVRIGTVYEEIMRHCQISYKSALFLMNRIRFAVAPDVNAPKLTGTVEADEAYCSGKPRHGDGKIHKLGRGTSKTPVFAVVERGGDIRRRVVPDVTGETLKAFSRRLFQTKSNCQMMEDVLLKPVAALRVSG